MYERFVPHHFSFSSIRTYLECPQKYAHRYVDGKDLFEDTKATIFGKAFHEGLEQYYRGNDYRRPMMAGIFRWVKKRKISEKEYYDLVRMGDAMMAVVKRDGRRYEVETTEKMYELDLKHPMGGRPLPVKFKCYIDLTSYTDIVDHKTVAKVEFDVPSKKAEYDMQLDLYSMLFRTINEREAERLSVQAITKRMRKPQVVYYDQKPDLIRETMLYETIRKILARIMKNDFTPMHNPETCRWCKMRARYLNSLA